MSKQLFYQPIFSFLFLCISNTERAQTANNIQINIGPPSPEKIKQPVENQPPRSIIKPHNIKKTMSFREFFWFLIKQAFLLVFYKVLYWNGFCKSSIAFKNKPEEIVLILISILLLIFYFFILSQYIKTYDYIPVSFSCLLIIFCFPFFLFFKKFPLRMFFFLLQESFNPFCFLQFYLVFQQDLKINYEELNKKKK